MLMPLAKRARDACASALAEVLLHAPALEQPYRSVAGACRGVPGVRTFFRETSDRVIRGLASTGRGFRVVHVGPLVAHLDVTHFTVANRYFAGVPYEPGVTEVLLASLRPGGVFVDVGANTGFFSVIAGLLVGPTGRVFAFEPNPGPRARLERQIELNGLAARTVVSQVALGDRNEENVDFYVSCCPANDGLSALTPAPAFLRSGALRADVKIAVPVRTFDSVAASLAIPRVDIMKIDVEGAECAVLAGMATTLGMSPPRRIICETMWNSDAHRMLSNCKYGARMLDEGADTPTLLFELADEKGCC